MKEPIKIPKPEEKLNLNAVYIKIWAIQELICREITILKEKQLSYRDIGSKLDMNRGNVCLLHKKQWFPKRNPEKSAIILEKLIKLNKQLENENINPN